MQIIQEHMLEYTKISRPIVMSLQGWGRRKHSAEARKLSWADALCSGIKSPKSQYVSRGSEFQDVVMRL